MLDILSFGTLGFWLGFVVRRKLGRQVTGKQRFALTACAALIFVLIFVFLGMSHNAIGRWSAFASLGAYWGLGIAERYANNLSKYWAEFWMPLLFLSLEVTRTFAVLAYCNQFTWAC